MKQKSSFRLTGSNDEYVSVGIHVNGLEVSDEYPLPVQSVGVSDYSLGVDNTLLNLLSDVCNELRIMNLYNAMAHNQELTKEDVE